VSLALLQRKQDTKTKEFAMPFTKGFDFSLDEVDCSSQLGREMGKALVSFSQFGQRMVKFG
jgi:hypothetical protein